MRHIKFIIPAVCLVVMAGCSQDSPTAVQNGSDTPTQQQIAQGQKANAESEREFTALLAEVEPHVIYAEDGTWTLAGDARLSPAAAEFARAAQREMQSQPNRVPVARPSASLVSANAPANQSTITWFWWGYRVGVPTGVASAVSNAWSTTGAAGAVKTFLLYYGSSGWVASAAGALVPAYAFVINIVDKVGGKRGVWLNIPWTIVPTVITAQ